MPAPNTEPKDRTYRVKASSAAVQQLLEGRACRIENADEDMCLLRVPPFEDHKDIERLLRANRIGYDAL